LVSRRSLWIYSSSPSGTSHPPEGERLPDQAAGGTMILQYNLAKTSLDHYEPPDEVANALV